jgi:cephalosporin hydroxylase
MAVADQTAIVDQFHTLYCASREQTWGNTYWLGHHVLKCPRDLRSYQEKLHELRLEFTAIGHGPGPREKLMLTFNPGGFLKREPVSTNGASTAGDHRDPLWSRQRSGLQRK